VPCRLEPLHLAAWRQGLAPLPAPKEARALLLDRRGPGGEGQAQGDARPRANPNAAPEWRASVPLRRRNHQGGQRSHRGGAHGGRARPASPKAVYYVSEVLSKTKARYPQI
jgi:hypothetical protein